MSLTLIGVWVGWGLVLAGVFTFFELLPALKERGWFYCRHITRELNERYLDRWTVRPQKQSGKNAWRIYLHHFLAPDNDGHHNHPWKWSFSIVLRGSYTEEYFDRHTGSWGQELTSLRKRRVRWLNLIRADRYHKITELHGDVWTLFFCGPLTGKGWGFWMPGRGYVPFLERFKERGLVKE